MLTHEYSWYTFQRKRNLQRIRACFITVRNSSCGKVMFLHLSVHRECTPPGQTPPKGRHPQIHPPRDGHCSGRYASYWNAFLFEWSVKVYSHLRFITRMRLQLPLGSRIICASIFFAIVIPIHPKEKKSQFHSQSRNKWQVWMEPKGEASLTKLALRKSSLARSKRSSAVLFLQSLSLKGP